MKNTSLQWLTGILSKEKISELEELKIKTYELYPDVRAGIKDAPFNDHRKILAAELLECTTLKQSTIAEILDVNPGRVSETKTEKHRQLSLCI